MARVIRDAVHGYIELCPVQECILSTRPFQRLRYIRQNDVAHLTYPGLTHTRFEHSLGTSCFARKMFRAVVAKDCDGSARDNIVAQARELVPGISRWSAEKVLGEVEKVVVLFGMLHDVGHLPFSHLTETALYGLERGVYDNWDEAADFGPLHEFAGYLLLRTRPIRSALRKCGLLRFEEALAGVFKKEDVAPPLSLTLRAFLSSDVDADRLDYLIRDGQAIGDEWGRFDLDRILLNLRLVQRSDGLRLVPRLQATSAIEAFFVERFRQYQWVHFHHRTVFFGAAFTRLLHLRLEHSLPDATGMSLGDFHHNRYVTQRGYFDDHTLWDRLVRRDATRHIEAGHGKLAKVLRLSLLHRERHSASLWKRFHDYQEFCDSVEPDLLAFVRQHWEKSHEQTCPQDLQNSAFAEEGVLNTFARSPTFKSYPLDFLRLEEEYVNAPGNDDVYVLLGKPHFTPFRTKYERGIGEMCDVLLWDETSGQFDAITEVSPIVESLQSAWRRGIGLFAFAVDLSGKPLTDTRRGDIVDRGREMLRKGLKRWFREEPSVAALLSR